MTYRKEIDGLRAIAVLAVIFFHAGFGYFSGGFVGVDIFFVISGYLIAAIIFKETSNGTFTIKNFYERRARRILPALLVVLIFSAPMSLMWMTPSDIIDYSQSLIAAPLFASNFLFFMESGYFDTATEFKPLFHTWSLAVEEQFYIFFPIMIIALWRFGFNAIIATVSLLFLASILFSEFMLKVDGMFSFYMLPTRIWQLLLGVSIAIMQYKEVNFDRGYIANNLLGLLGLILITFSILLFDKNSPMPGLYSLAPTIGAGLIIMFANARTIVGAILSYRIFVGIGLISYSAYLWHQPLFALVRIYRFGDVKPGMYASAILVTLLLAYITWKFIENPFRDKTKVSLKKLIINSTLMSLLLITIGTLGIITNGFEKLYKSRLTPIEALFFKNSQEIAKLKDQERHGLELPECFIEYANTPGFHSKFNQCFNKYGAAKVIMGDSHADNLSRILSHNKDNYNFSVLIRGRHCHAYHYYQNTLKSKCDLDKAIDFINNQSKQIAYVLYKQRGAYFIHNQDRKNIHDIGVDSISDIELYIDKARILQTIDYFNKVSEDTNIIWIGPWLEPLYPMHNPRKVSKYSNGKIDYIDNVAQAFHLLDMEIVGTLKTHRSNITYMPLHENKETSGFLPIVLENCITFNDTNHLSKCGENLAAPIIDEKIQRILARDQ